MAINEQELRDQNNRLVDHCQTMRNQLEEIRKLLDECEQHYNHAIKPDMESANHDALPKEQVLAIRAAVILQYPEHWVNGSAY